MKFRKKNPDKKAIKDEFQIMYKKIMEFSETVGRGASQRSQTEETLSMVDKGKYPKKFAEVRLVSLVNSQSELPFQNIDILLKRL